MLRVPLRVSLPLPAPGGFAVERHPCWSPLRSAPGSRILSLAMRVLRFVALLLLFVLLAAAVITLPERELPDIQPLYLWVR